MRASSVFLLVLLAVRASVVRGADADWLAPLVVPDGFEIDAFADDSQAHSIHTLTFDSLGRCVVSGPGYVKILEDHDKDGRCDAVKSFAEVSDSGLHGMLFVGRTLYGVDWRGVLRIPDADGDDQADEITPIGPRLNRGGEHGPHGIVLGPDGWLYVVVGNKAGLRKQHISSPHSPVLDPVEGNIFRMTTFGDRCEVVTTGLRNAYDLAFNAAGELFTVDSDNEAELGLPFYRYPRLVHAVPGFDVGWRDPDGQWPDYYPDLAPPICDMGRGSPAGVIVYDHTQFPEKYRGAVLAADWSWARIVAFFPERHGATWTATRQDLVRTAETITTATHGERDYAAGFYPTDVEVAPDGSVYISLGGRDTRGVVFRLRHTGATEGDRAAERGEDEGDPVGAALHLPQPDAAWSRAHRHRFRAKAGTNWVERLCAIARTENERAKRRVRALEYLLAEPALGKLSVSFLADVARADAPELRAVVADAVRLRSRGEDRSVLETLLNDVDPIVRRRALAAWATADRHAETVQCFVDRLADPDRLCRQAAARALQHIDVERWRDIARTHASPVVRLHAAMVDAWNGRAVLQAPDYSAILNQALACAETAGQKLDALRGLTYLLDRAFMSASVIRDRQIASVATLCASYPTDDWRINRELAKLFVRAEVPGAVDRLLGVLESDAPAIERLHVVGQLSRTRHAWEGEPLQRLVRAWLRLHVPPPDRKTGSVTDHRSRAVEQRLYWPRFCRDDPPSIVTELLRHGHHGPLLARPVKNLSGAHFVEVWSLLRDRYVRLDPSVRREIIRKLGDSGTSEAAEFVRDQIEDRAVRATAFGVLARFGRRADDALFQQAVADDDVDVAQTAVSALMTRELALTSETCFALVNQLGRTIDRPDRERHRRSILALLEARADDTPAQRRLDTTHEQMQMVRDWQEWFEDVHPDYPAAFARLRDPKRSRLDRRNVAGELLRRVDFASGDAQAGRQQFARLGCIQCHVHSGQGEPLGPDLTGVGKRLSRRDLMEAIVLPSKTIPPQYSYTLLRLRDGRVIGGVVKAEVNGTVQVQAGGGESFEIPANDVLERAPQPTSLMPTGTLDPAGDQDIADLFAFLTTGELQSSAQ